MRTIPLIVYLTALIALFYWITSGLGPQFMAAFTDFMFADYLAYYAHYIAPNLPGWGNPAVMLLIAALAVMIIPALVGITRLVAAFILALCIVKIWFSLTGMAGVSFPSPMFLTYAGFAAGWLLFIAVVADRGISGWLKEEGEDTY